MSEKFQPGRLTATPGVLQEITRDEILTALQRHLVGDWGDVSPVDHKANDDAVRDGGRLFSVYHSTDGVKFWIITEGDRSMTTTLLPEEY
jgi:hypothetical protein